MKAAAEKGDLALMKGCLVNGVDIDTRTEVRDQPKSASLLLYSCFASIIPTSSSASRLSLFFFFCFLKLPVLSIHPV